ncbi:MAG: hypothetical protein M3438_07640, partial [Pseudomonadota bacterium]|nr:hypothetical protein [Pseudomonadota bacterium]
QTKTAQTKNQLSATGYVLYRDAGRREWQTGYAMLIELTDELDFKVMYPIPEPKFWFDIRRK